MGPRGVPVGTVLAAALAGAVLTGPTPAAPLRTAIRMDVLWPYYHPAVATAATSRPIAWMNPTSIPHTVTHDACGRGAPCAFHSGPVPPGDTFAIPGLPPGRYAYHCALHPTMRGVLIVKDQVVHMSATGTEPDLHAASLGARTGALIVSR